MCGLQIKSPSIFENIWWTAKYLNDTIREKETKSVTVNHVIKKKDGEKIRC